MRLVDSVERARTYLEVLCNVKPNRRTGSPGNRDATGFFADTVRRLGYQVDTTPFECLDYVCCRAELKHDGEEFKVRASPYSLGCDISAKLVAVSTIAELEAADCLGKILLMQDEICSEQLMPKNFVFYNPERHQQIIALLERKQPAAIITATGRQADQVGALYPFPLLVDGDFDIPSVYCTDITGRLIAALQSQPLRLKLDACRLPSSATNVIATMNEAAAKKIVVTAHIDAYEDSPGASDNASGTAVLLLCAGMLSDYGGDHCVELAALNGEDHYSAAGQMDYLRRYGGDAATILLAINVDDVGYRTGRSQYSFYDCPAHLQSLARSVLRDFSSLASGPQWFNGDHMLFVQTGVPSMAVTSECMPELMRTITHTDQDTPELIDSSKLVEIAAALDALVRAL